MEKVIPVKEAITKLAKVTPAPKVGTKPSTDRTSGQVPVDEGWVLPIE